MVLSEDSSLCKVMLDGEHLEQMSEFKYLGYIVDEKGTDDAECSMKVVKGRKMAGAIKSLVDAKGIRLECARVLYDGMLLPVLMYSSETMSGIRGTSVKYRYRTSAGATRHFDGLLLGYRSNQPKSSHADMGTRCLLR